MKSISKLALSFSICLSVSTNAFAECQALYHHWSVVSAQRASHAGKVSNWLLAGAALVNPIVLGAGFFMEKDNQDDHAQDALGERAMDILLEEAKNGVPGEMTKKMLSHLKEVSPNFSMTEDELLQLISTANSKNLFCDDGREVYLYKHVLKMVLSGDLNNKPAIHFKNYMTYMQENHPAWYDVNYGVFKDSHKEDTSHPQTSVSDILAVGRDAKELKQRASYDWSDNVFQSKRIVEVQGNYICHSYCVEGSSFNYIMAQGNTEDEARSATERQCAGGISKMYQQLNKWVGSGKQRRAETVSDSDFKHVPGMKCSKIPTDVMPKNTTSPMVVDKNDETNQFEDKLARTRNISDEELAKMIEKGTKAD